MIPLNGNHRLAIVPPSAELIAKGARFVDRMEQMRALRQGEAPPAPPATATTPATAATQPRQLDQDKPERLAPLDPAAILSPSKLAKFLDCHAKFHYRYVLGLPDSRGGAAGLGAAVHEAIAENYRQKIETKADLPTAGAVALFMDAFTRQLTEITLDAKDNADELRSTGEVITRVYMDQVAPRIQPAAVELHVEGLIGGVAVQGYVDVLDVDGVIVDLKTAAKKPSGVPANYRAQIATYAMLAPGASGRARLDTLTKGRTVSNTSHTIQVAESDRKYVTRLYSIAQEKMRDGLVIPSRGSNLCSKRYCAFHSQCVSDYGGEVKP